jgi:hypothetical protein
MAVKEQRKQAGEVENPIDMEAVNKHRWMALDGRLSALFISASTYQSSHQLSLEDCEQPITFLLGQLHMYHNEHMHQ